MFHTNKFATTEKNLCFVALVCSMTIACGVKTSPQPLLPNLPYEAEEKEFSLDERQRITSAVEEEIVRRKGQKQQK
jgi:hypothetical protein